MERLTPEELQDEVSKFLNSFSSDKKIDKFVGKMRKDHRTLQQAFTRLCMAWLTDLAEREHFDARNEASVKLAKHITESLKGERHYLPFI